MPLMPFSFSDPPYTPAMRVILSISNTNPAVIVTSLAHLYLDGLIVCIKMPTDIFGMTQINELEGPITVLAPNVFSIAIDATGFDPFVIPGTLPSAFQYPQAIPVGTIGYYQMNLVRERKSYVVPDVRIPTAGDWTYA